MSSLYNINARIEQVIQLGFALDEETGEFWTADNLEALELERNEKLEAVACFIKNLEAEAVALRAEEKALAERRQTKEKKAEHLKQYLRDCMTAADLKQFETAKCKLTVRNSKAVEIDEGAEIDKAYLVFTSKPDKKAIKAALEAGESVAGARIVERQNLQLK